MKLFPLFTVSENMRFLIIGHGNVAVRKAVKTAEFTGNITVVTGETVGTERLQAMVRAFKTSEADTDGIVIYDRELKREDLEAADICICAFGDESFHKDLYEYCIDKRIPLNVVDVPDMCTFVFPAVIKRGDLIAAVSTSGKSPVYAAVFKKEIEKTVPDNVEEILEYMGELRAKLPDILPEQCTREKVYKHIVDIIFQTGKIPSDKQTEEIIRKAKEDLL